VKLEALLIVLMSFVLLITVGATLTVELGLLGVLVAEVALVLAPVALWLAFRQVPRDRIGIARGQARPLAIAAGVLAGLGGFYVMAVAEASVLERLLPVPPELKEAMKRLVLPESGARPIIADVLALAIAPAVCEEALFRGGVMAAFLGPRRRDRWLAVVLAAVLFGAFHASLYRLLPATGLGLVLGFVRVRSDALGPAIAFHITNNVAVIALTRLGRDEPPSLQTATGTTLFALAVAALTLGLYFTSSRSQRA
jgi:sodium transport system permease protein